MALGDPWGHDGKTYDGKEMRQLVDAAFQQTGVVGLNDFLIEQQSSPGPTVKCRAGEIIVTATGAGLFGKYEVPNDASINSPAFSATSTNGRKDRLILRVTSGVAALEIVQGVASGSPVEPAITGDNFEELALITLPGSTTNITTAMITDRRNHASALGAPMLKPGTTLPLYACRAYRQGALTVANNAVTLIAMDNETYDNNGDFNTGTGRYTVPVDGLYDIRGSAMLGVNSAATEYHSSIYKNGVETVIGSAAQAAAAAANWAFPVSDVLQLVAGDLIDLRVFNNSGNGAALTVGSVRNYLTIRKV